MNKILKKYSSLSKTVRASIWFLVCTFLQKGISVITTPIFTRLMSPSEYGTYNVFNSWLGIVSIIVTMNLFYGGYAQGLIKFENERSVYSSSMQGLMMVLAFAWLIIYILFHDFWNELLHLDTIYMLLMFAMIWSTGVFNFWSMEQRTTYLYRNLVIVTIIVSIAKPIVGIILILSMEDKVFGRILGLTIVELIGYFGLFYKQMSRGKVFFSKKFWLYALKFNIPLIPHYLSQTILSSSDRIMVERIVSSDAAGIYSLAYSISLIMTLFNNALSQTITPWMYTKIRDKKIKDLSSISYITLIVIAGCNIMLIAFAPEMVAIFAPESYYEAICIIPPVAMSVYYMFAYDLFSKIEFYYEKTKLISIATVISAILNIVLNGIFIQKYGYIAAGYTTLVCYMLYAVFHYIVMNRICQNECNGEYPYSTKVIVLISLVFTLISLLFLILYNHAIIRYSLIVMICIAMFIKRKDLILFFRSIIALRSNKERI